MAKTTLPVSGNILMLYMGADAGSAALVGCSTANGFSLTNEQLETTCKDGTNPPPRTYVSGVQEWGMTGTFNVRYDDANQFSALAAAAKDATQRTFLFASTNTDDPYWQGDGFISSFNIVANQGAVATVDVTISPLGAIYLFNT